MRILSLTPELPYWPGGGGGATRQFHLLRRLVELGHDVTVVAPATVGDLKRREDLEAAGVRALLYERPASRFGETAGVVARHPALIPAAVARPVFAWQVSVFWAPLRALALRAIREQTPDVVLVDHDYAAGWISDVPPDIPAALTFHNLTWKYYETRAVAAPRALRPFLAMEAWRFARHDRRHIVRYGLAIAVSDDDAAILRETSDVPVAVIPNGVDTQALPALPDSGGAPSVLFTGTLAYPPNAHGIAWFVDHVWPAVRASHPDARLRIVGRGASRAVSELAERSGVELVGYVPDLLPYFEEATVAIVPVFSGGGTRLKAVEAMSAQRAIVSTRLGVEGLAVEPGGNVLVEDDPDQFARAVATLLEDGARRRELASAGRRLVEERYDWRPLGERLGAELEALAARAASQPRPLAHTNEV
jgi:glycosyltransferase involved in cell wall biosynthesis